MASSPRPFQYVTGQASRRGSLLDGALQRSGATRLTSPAPAIATTAARTPVSATVVRRRLEGTEPSSSSVSRYVSARVYSTVARPGECDHAAEASTQTA